MFHIHTSLRLTRSTSGTEELGHLEEKWPTGNKTYMDRDRKQGTVGMLH